MKQGAKGTSSEEPTTKGIILSKALALFAEKGYAGTTVQDIAKAVGIKAASLYAHYSGKDGIFRAVFAEAAQSWARDIEEAFAEASESKSLADGLTVIIRRYAGHAANANVYRFWTRLYVFPPPVMKKKDFQLIAELDESFAKSLRAFFDAMGKPGRIEDTEALLTTITRLAWGFLLCDSQGDLGKMEREIQSCIKSILKGF